MSHVGSVRHLRRLSRAGAMVAVICLLVGSSWGSISRGVQAQGQKQLFISVLAQDGAPITDLAASDVTVLENDVEAKTVKLEPINWPMKLTVLVDNGSRS